MVLAKYGFVAVFGMTALVCFGTLWRVRRLEEPDVRRGLTGLLITSGLWATIEAVRVLVTTPRLKIMLYLIGLIIGLSTVGAWLYFCSAYAGHDYHHSTLFKRAALGLYLAIVVIKLTNPLHGQYFTVQIIDTPYPYLAVQLLPLHWVVTGLAYILSAIGFYMLYSTLHTSRYETASLGIVVSLAPLPVVLTIASYVWPDILLKLNYEPLGVAAFAAGVVYFVDEKFVAVPTFGRQQLIDNLNDPVILLNRDGIIQYYNTAATQTFSRLDGAQGQPVENSASELLADSDKRGIIKLPRDGSDQYYLRDENEITVGSTTLGRALIYTDVTKVERQRRELTRQNEQLDDFAKAINHELRNTLAIIQGHIELAAAALPKNADSTAGEALATADKTADRMTEVIGNLSLLAQYGQSITHLSDCRFPETVNRAWVNTAVGELALTTNGDGVIKADPNRLIELLSAVFKFAAMTNAKTVTVRLSSGQLVIITDGEPIPADRTSDALKYGVAVPSAESGMVLPNVLTLARVHGWNVTVDDTFTGGVRLVIKRLTTEQDHSDDD
ncbi:sensor histidine kinase [Salinigranum halophilum]|uniref:sensor histidine kinase n=1 Tax=Salinigranum halophilum TaxID=2565931 RepID=UPI0010A87FD3|nr:histidine kinase N-terminal 7TM domain-containing protein [Salinigranum halophilum]